MTKQKMLSYLLLKFEETNNRQPSEKELKFLIQEVTNLWNKDQQKLRRDKKRTGKKGN